MATERFRSHRRGGRPMPARLIPPPASRLAASLLFFAAALTASAQPPQGPPGQPGPLGGPPRPGDPPPARPDHRRGQPKVLAPVEGKAAAALVEVRSYIFDRNGEWVWVLDQPGPRPGLDRPPPGPGDPRFGEAPPPKDPPLWIRPVPLDKLTDGVRPAERARPLPLAVLVAGFPLDEQFQEFGVRVYGGDVTYRDILDDTVTDSVREGEGPPRRVERPAFRFKEVEAQRRVVDADGWPLDPQTGRRLAQRDDGWGTLDLRGSYGRWLTRTGRRTEPDAERLSPAIVPGLCMPKLPTTPEGRYPDLEGQLQTLIFALRNAGAAERARPFQTDLFDPFAPGPADRPPG